MNYAGFWIRFVAYMVDNLILFIALGGVAILLGLMGLQLAGQELIFLVVFFVYFAAMQSSARQATLGKQLVGLKVTDTNGGRISFLRALARTAATIISSLTLMIGYLLAAFTGRKQALHDMIAGTLVVRDNPGRVMLALVVAVLGPFVMIGAAMMFAGAMVAGMAAGMMGEMAQAPKPPAVQTAKPAAQPAKPAAPAPTAAKPAAPAPMAAKPAAPAPTAAAPAPTAAAPAKPAAPAAPEAPKMAEAPKAAPMKVAAAAPLEVKEVPRPPTAQEPAKEEAKEDAKEEQAKEEAAAKPAAEAAPKPAAPAAPLVPKALLSGPVIQGPKYNDLTTAVLYRDAAAVNELISYGKWADKADSTGTTPLMVAVSLGDAQIAEALLKAGANPNRALPVARERGNGAMASLLERYGAR